MENNQGEITPEIEVSLRKSLEVIGMNSSEIDSIIQKSIKKGEDGKQETVQEMAKEAKKENETVADEATENETPKTSEKPKENEEDEFEKTKKSLRKALCEKLDDHKNKILEKAIKDFEDMTGELRGLKKVEPTTDLKKSIEEDITKSIKDSYDSQISELSDLVKSLKTDLDKVLDQPLGRKSIVGSYNYLSRESNEPIEGAKELSLRNDSDSIIKSMEDSLSIEKDEAYINLLTDNIKDFTISKKISPDALKYLSKKKNITFKS